MFKSHVARATVGAILLSIAACTGEPTQVQELDPVFAISDGAHSGGNLHFFFLPPVVKQPTISGVFNANLEPTVEVCALSGLDCASTIATFTRTSGPDGETIAVHPEDELYQLNWKTSHFALSDAVNYRIVVRVGNAMVGFVDVDVATNASQFKNLSTNEFIGLVDGRTLPIKFRIEDGYDPGPPGPWDASADFSETSNPNGEWSSGWIAALGGPFTLFTLHEQQESGVLAAWRDPYFAQQFGTITPTFQKNISASTMIYNVFPGWVSLHSGCGTNYMAVLRWTAPSSGNYAVQAQFFEGNSGNTDAYIILDGNAGSPLLSAPATNVLPSYAGILALLSGETLDFIVGAGGDGCGADSTPFTATIQRQ